MFRQKHFPLFRFFSDCWIEKHEKTCRLQLFSVLLSENRGIRQLDWFDWPFLHGSLPLGERSGLRNCSDEEDKIYIMCLPDDGKYGHGSQVDEGLAGFDARFDDAYSQQ